MEERETVFRHWVDVYAGVIQKVARDFASNQEDVEDLLQEIYFQEWLSIPGFRGESQEATWIYRVAMNTAVAWKRRECYLSRWRRLMANGSMDNPETALMSSKIWERLDKKERVCEMYKAICALPKKDGLLALMYLNGLKYAEMANILMMTESNIGVRLHRIRKQLGKIMEEKDM